MILSYCKNNVFPSIKKQVVTEGNAVRLPCMVDTLAGFVLIWRKNGRVISIGDQIVDKVPIYMKLDFIKFDCTCTV